MTTIYLIRHAEAEGNLYRIAQGQYDSNLTDRGWRQVRALERRFADIHIDAVYDPRPHNAVDPGKILPAMVHECVYERPRIMPGGRMNHHACRLVHHQNILVLINNVQRDVLRRNLQL